MSELPISQDSRKTIRISDVHTASIAAILDRLDALVVSMKFHAEREILRLIFEELLCNSATHARSIGPMLAVSIQLDPIVEGIEYIEHQVLRIDFACIIERFDQPIDSDNGLTEGGMGLRIIKDLSKKFEYRYEISDCDAHFLINM